MHTDNSDYQIVWLIRRLFRALAQRSSDGLTDVGISAADRAVMEFLYPDQNLSVPEIASRYQVSRQHVQATVNRLLDAGLAVASENPRHKRSPLIGLTRRGNSLFAKIAKRDLDAIDALFERISKNDRQVTRETLETLLERLQ